MSRTDQMLEAMRCVPLHTQDAAAVARLLTQAFEASDGPDEGQAVGQLALALTQRIDDADICGFAAMRAELLGGARPEKLNRAGRHGSGCAAIRKSTTHTAGDVRTGLAGKPAAAASSG